MENTDILTFVLNSLQESKGHWKRVCSDTGLGYSWITKLAQGHIDNPSVNKIQILADYFRESAPEIKAA